jgi:hypothetical protein
MAKRSKPNPGPTPPRPLGNHGSALWDWVQRDYQILDVGGIEMLAQACAALDDVENYAGHIAKDGPTIRVNGVLKDHPLLKHLMAARSFVVRTLQRLGLDVEAVKPVGRPPQKFGWSGNHDD